MICRMPCPARNPTEYEIRGRLRNGMAVWVRSSVSGHSLVPNPAANITALISDFRLRIPGICLSQCYARKPGHLERPNHSVRSSSSAGSPSPLGAFLWLRRIQDSAEAAECREPEAYHRRHLRSGTASWLLHLGPLRRSLAGQPDHDRLLFRMK